LETLVWFLSDEDHIEILLEIELLENFELYLLDWWNATMKRMKISLLEYRIWVDQLWQHPLGS
jgi:hypothetical protein